MLAVSVVHPALAQAPAPVFVAVADFDNIDTSGESSDRTIAHAARVQAFGSFIRDNLALDNTIKVVRLSCPGSPCTPRTIPPAQFIEAARDSGARLVVYGGIRKMSTLVQIGTVQALDLKTDRLVLDQHLTFRGDSDEAFLRAAIFVTDYLTNLPLSP